jgi:hypothetical protein
MEDVKEECEKYGKVLEMKIPRPTGGSRQSNGVGKIFVKFDTPVSAGKALRTLAGRKFADRTVVTTYFSEVNLPLLCSEQLLTFFVGKLRGFCLVISMVGVRWPRIRLHFHNLTSSQFLKAYLSVFVVLFTAMIVASGA